MSIASSTLTGAASGAAMGSVAAPWGTVAGAVVGAGVGLFKGIKEKNASDAADEEEKRMEIERMNQERQLQALKGQSIARNTLKQGNHYSMQMFARGNNLTSKDVEPKLLDNVEHLSSSGSMVVGNRHEEGGEVIDNANVESGEILEDGRVFSDRIQHPSGATFAVLARELTSAKGVKEAEMNDTMDRYKIYTNERELEIIDLKLGKLFELQGEIVNTKNI